MGDEAGEARSEVAEINPRRWESSLVIACIGTTKKVFTRMKTDAREPRGSID
jgi:hypothetical protein